MKRVAVIWSTLAALAACSEEGAISEMKAESTGIAGATVARAGNGAGAIGQAGAMNDVDGSMAGSTGGQAGGAAGAGAGGVPAAGAGGAQAAAGSGGAGMAAASGPTGKPTFTAIFKEILTVGSAGNCMFAGCHGAPPDPMLNGNLTIMFDDQMGAYKNLVDVKSTSTACTGRALVIPGDAAGSLLIQKFGDAPPCGVKMPIGRPLTEAQIKQIETWIDDGAKND